MYIPPLAKRFLQIETQHWSQQSGVPASKHFRYLLFPKIDAIAYDDALLSQNPAMWDRVLLNELHEQNLRAVPARDARTGAMRFVDGATMQLTPSDPADVQPALNAFVELVGKRRDPKIRSLVFRENTRDKMAIVTLEVNTLRATNIFEYAIKDGLVIPLRHTSLVPGW